VALPRAGFPYTARSKTARNFRNFGETLRRHASAKYSYIFFKRPAITARRASNSERSNLLIAAIAFWIGSGILTGVRVRKMIIDDKGQRAMHEHIRIPVCLGLALGEFIFAAAL
jgi:hypothetical protein